MNALIGSGIVGQSLASSMHFDHIFNRNNIADLVKFQFDHLVIAAPSGNRLRINNGDSTDTKDVDTILSTVKLAQPNRVTLISSVDAITAPNSVYGKNRLWLENNLQATLPTGVLRLSTLIGKHIQKNVLYDIKHSQYLKEIDAAAWLQWCLLDDLQILVNDTKPGASIDVVSEPIQTQEILTRFVPELQFNSRKTSLWYNQQPYLYNKQQIFSAMDQYMS